MSQDQLSYKAVGFTSEFILNATGSAFVSKKQTDFYCIPVYVATPNKQKPLEPPQAQCDEQYRLCTLITGIVVGAASMMIIGLVGIWWWSL